ncbi:MAG: glutamine amidotransferase family protein [Methanomicrobiaceae archaeon]|nr:glutamine amidotransferase family protein [Methanomicrobiaceae archaeon]
MCGIISVIDRSKNYMDGGAIKNALALMNERGSGEGAGYAVYGAYPDYKDYYALHVFYDNIVEPKEAVEELLEKWGKIEYAEEIPTYEQDRLRKQHIPWRYFFKPDIRLLAGTCSPEEDAIINIVNKVNTEIKGALIFSSGKDIGVFKASGWPEDVANFYRIEDYEGYIWMGHNRYPTNTSGWWGGAHPFNLLNWSVIHNGEITSYGTNRRYIESFGYKCTMKTDTEVVAYLADLLGRRHELPEELSVKALAPPFWDDIDRMSENERDLHTALRMAYGGALMNGPFAIVIAKPEGIVGFTDRIKLRPMIAAESGDRLYISSEEAAIRTMEQNLDRVWMPSAGEPVIGMVRR